MTFAEKVLFGHLADPAGQDLEAGKSMLALHPDRVAMQDATAQMALLQYLSAGRKTTAVPTTVHCDHLIRANQGASSDMRTALDENREVYDFLLTASQKAGIGSGGGHTKVSPRARNGGGGSASPPERTAGVRCRCGRRGGIRKHHPGTCAHAPSGHSLCFRHAGVRHALFLLHRADHPWPRAVTTYRRDC